VRPHSAGSGIRLRDVHDAFGPPGRRRALPQPAGDVKQHQATANWEAWMARRRGDAADLMTAVGRHWGWVLAFGVITALTGIVVLIWPGRTLLVVAVLFGIQLIVTGIFRFGAAFAAGENGATRVLFAILGLFSLIIGLYAVRHIFITLLALGLLLGIFWVISGVTELFNAAQHKTMGSRGWTALMGVLSIVAGLILLAYPGLSLVTLALLLSIWLLVLGLMEITLAFRLRSA
jgi:uncharacterized membrane protein HdeD (DUF308 family)